MATSKPDLQNWWYYHKWHVCIGAVLLFCLIDIGKDAFHIGEIKADYQIAYVGKNYLPDDTVAQIEALFSSLGEDCNQDGKIVTVLHQYPTLEDLKDSESAYYQTAKDVALQSDLAERDSFFFLLEDPVLFEKNYDTLAYTDGSLPAVTAKDFEHMYINWTDSPALAAADLGTYTATVLGTEETGSSNELVRGLCLARRGFWTDKTCNYTESCEKLWNRILGNEQKQKE